MSALSSTVLLTCVSFFSQAVGFFYRVCLSRMVGSEVMGLYQLVMPAYSVLLSLTAVGFTAACSQLTARRRATGESAAEAVRVCVTGFLCALLAVALVTAPLSDAISVHLLHDARTRLALLLLLPCALLTGLENIHKHAFYGAGLVRPPALTEVCEQLIRAGAVLTLLWLFLPQTPERTVGLVVCGMILCEVFSALTLTLLYRRFTAGDAPQASAPSPALRRAALSIALPAGATALLGNVMGAAIAVIIPQRLIRAGQDVSAAMSAFGVMCGMTMPLLTLPAAFVSAMGLVLLPRMARHSALGRADRARGLASKALTVTAWLIFPAAALMAVLAQPLARLLFHEPTAGAYAAPLALAVVLSCFETVLGVCLNGLGRQRITARNGLVSTVVQLSLTWQRMALPGVGLRGYVEAVVAASALGCALNWLSLSRAIHLRPRLFPWLVAPGLAALLAALWAHLLYPVLVHTGLGQGASLALCGGMGCVLYLCAMSAQGAGRGGLTP